MSAQTCQQLPTACAHLEHVMHACRALGSGMAAKGRMQQRVAGAVCSREEKQMKVRKTSKASMTLILLWRIGRS